MKITNLSQGRINQHTPATGERVAEREDMTKKELEARVEYIEGRLKKLLAELQMDNEEYYNLQAEKYDSIKRSMKPSDMYAYKCGVTISEIQWILNEGLPG